MYRPSTESERRRIGVPHRVTGSSWYRSSNVACVYPIVDTSSGYDFAAAKRLIASRYDRSFAAPQRFPLIGDGLNTLAVNKTNLKGETLKIALTEARYFDWLDQRLQRLRENMPRPTAQLLEDILIEKGFVPNRYLLEINRHLQASAEDLAEWPWNLPSRLFRFPLEVQADKEGRFRIGLMHPELKEHPFVLRVAAAIKPHRIAAKGAPNAYGYSQAPATWWHAVDLIEEHSEELLRTRQYTSAESIVGAVTFALGHGGKFSIAQARHVLETVGATPPPADRIAETVLKLMPPSFAKPDGQKGYWAINSRAKDPVAMAWLRVWGIDAGWFTYQRRYLHWSDHGRSMYQAVEKMAEISSKAESIS